MKENGIGVQESYLCDSRVRGKWGNCLVARTSVGRPEMFVRESQGLRCLLGKELLGTKAGNLFEFMEPIWQCDCALCDVCICMPTEAKCRRLGFRLNTELATAPKLQ